MVGDFLAPKLEGATYPPEAAQRLAAMGYRIDVQPGLGREADKRPFLADLDEVFRARRRALLTFLADDDWDVLQVHVMETDRVNHFVYGLWEAGDPVYCPAFERFYSDVDGMLGEVVARLDENTALFVLSDHGFCGVRREVYLNAWLQAEGYLEPLGGERPSLKELTSASRAYCMDPGRIYVNLRGREPAGGRGGRQLRGLAHRAADRDHRHGDEGGGAE